MTSTSEPRLWTTGVVVFAVIAVLAVAGTAYFAVTEIVRLNRHLDRVKAEREQVEAERGALFSEFWLSAEPELQRLVFASGQTEREAILEELQHDFDDRLSDFLVEETVTQSPSVFEEIAEIIKLMASTLTTLVSTFVAVSLFRSNVRARQLEVEKLELEVETLRARQSPNAT